MTTRKFSAIKLPHPDYTLDIGCLNLKEENLNLPSWIPRFSNKLQVVEVCRSVIQSTGSDIRGIIGKFILIENARPELFLRRDFISKFVHTGTVHLSHDCTRGNRHPDSYQIYTADNVLSLVLNEKLYRRFGLVGKKVIPSRVKKSKSRSYDYRIDIDLKDAKIMQSNKYQDKLVQIFRRLNPINKLYFRFVPKESIAAESTGAATITFEAINKSLEFFRYVINEYAIDGFEPVPLTGCHEVGHKLERKWTNYYQRHPELSLSFMTQGGGGGGGGGSSQQLYHNDNDVAEDNSGMISSDVQRNPEILSKVMDMVDWLGYQLLSLDCDREEISCRYPDDVERFDVSCTQIGGLMDFRQIQENLGRIFGHVGGGSSGDGDNNNQSPNTVLRALILYANRHDVSDSGVVLLQDNSNAKDLITVIGL